MRDNQSLKNRAAPLAMSSKEFRELAAQLIDRIADFLDSLPQRAVTRAESPAVVRQALAAQRTLPEPGADPAQLLNESYIIDLCDKGQATPIPTHASSGLEGASGRGSPSGVWGDQSSTACPGLKRRTCAHRQLLDPKNLYAGRVRDGMDPPSFSNANAALASQNSLGAVQFLRIGVEGFYAPL
jgi:hypothetical protein